MIYNIILVLARIFGSSARLLPESYGCTSRISQRQVTKQLTKITAKKTKPKVKLTKMNITKVLTNCYEDQQKPCKKTNPICCSNSLFLSEKPMIPSYIKYAKQSQLENDSDVRN
jgi:hypothetical protein